MALIGAEIGAISYADTATQRYVHGAGRGLTDAYLRSVDTWALHEGLAGQSFRQREPVTITDLASDKDVPRSIVHNEGLRGYVCVPLLRGQRRLGIIEVFDRAPRLFTTHEVESLELVAAAVSSVVESIVLEEELRFLREERARILRDWASQTLTAAQTQRADLARDLRHEAGELEARHAEGESSCEFAVRRLHILAAGIESAEVGRVDMVPLVREQLTGRWASQVQRDVRLDVGDWPSALPLDLTTRLYLLMHAMVADAAWAASSRVTLGLGGDQHTMWIEVCDDRPACPGSDPVKDATPGIVTAVRGLDGLLTSATGTDGLGGIRVSMPLASARPALPTLTPRERRVLQALPTGATNRAIAAELGISPKTLQNHLTAIYRKLGVTSRAQAIRFVP